MSHFLDFITPLAAAIAIGGAFVCLMTTLRRPSAPRSTGEIYDPKDESDLPGWETKP